MKKRTNPVIEMVNSDVTTSTVSTLREVGDQPSLGDGHCLL